METVSGTNGTVVVVNNNGETRKQRCRISDSTILQKSELTALREIQVDHLSDLSQLNDCIDAAALLKRGLAVAYVLDSAIRVRYRYGDGVRYRYGYWGSFLPFLACLSNSSGNFIHEIRPSQQQRTNSWAMH